MLVTGKIGDQRHDRRGDGPGALQYPPGQYAEHAVGLRRDQSAEGEQQQATDNHRFAADAVGEHAEGDLQEGLGEAVGTDGHTDQQRCGTVQLLTVGCQHRQDHEQTEHAEGEHTGQRRGRTALFG